MVISVGTRVGSYQILSALGAGGMGEVYRARDLRLNRDVALKILPERFAQDPDRLARFTREAQTLAALNHPRIAHVYGLEQADASAAGDGAAVHALAMELVEGEDLSQRLARGPLPLSEVLSLGSQIADALDAAHEQGIVHRDLKPGNIKVREDGTIKVLDFGLAKALARPGTASNAVVENVTESPTFAAAGTAAGIILGSAAYMAPEQARGRAVDHRADIWAFGVVLFEMLTGSRPFGGDSISDTLAAILKDAPAWSDLPPGVPPDLRRLLGRMLEKDPQRRLRDVGHARMVLDELRSGAGERESTAVSRSRSIGKWRTALPWSVAGIASVAAVVFWLRGSSAPPLEPPTLRFTVPVGSDSLQHYGLPTLSPDGRYLAFVREGVLWVRPLHELEARRVPGTAGVQHPFWSPDSRQLAYMTTGALWRVGLDGAPPVRIAPYSFSKGGRTPGGVWRTDDLIVFAPAATGSGLLSVPAQGGEFQEFYKRREHERDLHRPSLLPDGRSLLFVVDRGWPEQVPGDGRSVGWVGADTIGVLADGRRVDILTLKGETLDSAVYSPTGHVLYHRETGAPGVWAVPFSPERLEATGRPFLVAPQGAWVQAGPHGLVVYADNELSGSTELAWLDLKTGQASSAHTEMFTDISYPRLSPDGRKVTAVTRSPDAGQILVVADLERRTHVTMTDRVDLWSRPVWADSGRLLFARNLEGAHTLVIQAADGMAPPVVLARGMQPHVAGGRVVFVRLAEGRGGDLWHTALPGSGEAPTEPELLQQLPTHEWEPALSPDRRLLVFSSGDVGQSQIILRTYPDAGGRWQVSTEGGQMPLWSPQGDALYYRDLSARLMRVAVNRSPQVTLGRPELITRPPNVVARRGYDISADGRRLLMIREIKQDTSANLVVMTGWRPPGNGK